jgi:hypothetical protein
VPLLGGTQGDEKVDCATECVGGKKWNSTWLPTAAVMELGLNERPFWPTLTTWTPLAGEAVADGAAVAAPLVESGGFP